MKTSHFPPALVFEGRTVSIPQASAIVAARRPPALLLARAQHRVLRSRVGYRRVPGQRGAPADY